MNVNTTIIGERYRVTPSANGKSVTVHDAVRGATIELGNPETARCIEKLAELFDLAFTLKEKSNA